MKPYQGRRQKAGGTKLAQACGRLAFVFVTVALGWFALAVPLVSADTLTLAARQQSSAPTDHPWNFEDEDEPVQEPRAAYAERQPQDANQQRGDDPHWPNPKHDWRSSATPVESTLFRTRQQARPRLFIQTAAKCPNWR